MYYTWKKHVQWEAKLFTEKYNENEYQPSAEQPNQNHFYRTELSCSFVMSLTHRWMFNPTCLCYIHMHDDDDGKKNVKNSSAISGSVAILFFFIMLWNFLQNSSQESTTIQLIVDILSFIAWENIYANRNWSHDNENFESQIILWLMPLRSIYE